MQQPAKRLPKSVEGRGEEGKLRGEGAWRGGGVVVVREGPGGHQSPTMSGVEGQKAAT